MHINFSTNRPNLLRLFGILAAVAFPVLACTLLSEPDLASQQKKPVGFVLPQQNGKLPLASLIDENCEYDEELDENVHPPVLIDKVPHQPPGARHKYFARHSSKAPNGPLAKRIPVKGTRITSAYGMRVHPITGKHKFHNGVDFSAKLNQRVYSVLDGKVVRCGPRGALGIAVEIYHPHKKTTTIYGHLNHKLVSKGQTVKAGQPIGLAGTTGRSTGVHLHFIVKQNKKTVEPLGFLATLPTYMPNMQQPPVHIATAKVKSKSKPETESPPRIAAAFLDPVRNFGIFSDKANIGIGAHPQQPTVARAKSKPEPTKVAMSPKSDKSTALASRRAPKSLSSHVTKIATKGPSKVKLAKAPSKNTLAKVSGKLTLAKATNKRLQIALKNKSSKHLLAEKSSSKKAKAILIAKADKQKNAAPATSTSRVADGARLAAEMARELTSARAALRSAQKRSDTAAMLYNEGVISRNAADQTREAAAAAERKVQHLESRMN